MVNRGPYDGLTRKLLLAFDVGTTYSGVSYSVLDPGLVPETKSVTRFPSQQRSGGDAKIPTIIYYDRHGAVRAVGAEALEFEASGFDETEKFFKAEWFKLHLRPGSISVPDGEVHHIPALPPRKTVTDVLADFLGYLFTCARKFIIESIPNGAVFWESFGESIEYIFTHPNGWGGQQQAQMRDAAVKAGLITEETPELVQFCTEGEASLHFCINNGLSVENLQPTDAVLILDCGGGTIDISTYAPNPDTNAHLSVTEIATPQCLFQGSIWVTRRAETFIQAKLGLSRFKDDIPNIVKIFDQSTKLVFKNAGELQSIRFAGMRDTDATLNIRGGQLKLSGGDVATFFDPSVDAILRVVTEQQKTCAENGHTLKAIFLVGGFAASDFLFGRLQDRLEEMNLQFCRPDSHVNKAVADGAVSFKLDHVVTSRIAKMHYGVPEEQVFSVDNPDHMQRRNKVFVRDDGRTIVQNAFNVILHKGMQVSEAKEFTTEAFEIAGTRRDLKSLDIPIYAYRGPKSIPRWMDVEPNMYSVLCRVTADTRGVSKRLYPRYQGKKKNRKMETKHFRIKYTVILHFGLTELKAQIAWRERGVEKRSPAQIVYE